MVENNFYLELLNNSNLANISNEEKEMMQIKLCTLLGKVTERYTMGDSSSVPVEIAEELLKSITFLLNKEMKNPQSIVKLIEEDKSEDIFVDNKSMDDERLRKLIDEIRVCRFTSDKITIIHNEVKSLEDLVEILNNCIWEDEVEELVNSLSKEEIEALKYYLNNKLNDNISNTGWEQKFIEVISNF
ncbi:MAG: DUF6179 domain-containing protein [Clostridium saudiense]|uniref:DUF6179 domain-containing protein n=1 Tax=Clostridium saudiense TaxID=1414720 RepID=UPI003993F91D